MALPLKSGADFYTQEIRRVALQNEGSDLPEYLSGSIYFNTNSESNTSDRIRYRGRNAWHSVANLEDIARLEELIAELGDVSGGNITDLLNKIEALEGNFTDGAANDSLKLAGQLPSYYATASGLSALQEKVSAFLDGEADSDAVLENLKEIQAFLDSYDGATSLADMFAAVNTQIADRYTKGEVDTKLSAYRLLTNGTFDVLVNAKNGIETDEITIGGIKLSVVEGQLQIDGDAFATGQLASGGIGEAGSGSGASGIVILEDWSKYDDSVAQVVGAVLGKDLHDRLGVAESTLESLVGKATNVSVVQTLTSGKEIGAITIDGVATKLYAPSTYAWGEITSKPTTVAGYGITDVIGWRNGDNLALDIRENALFKHAGYGYSSQGWYANGPAISIGHSANYIMQLQMQNGTGDIWKRAVDAGSQKAWRKILDSGNYTSVLDNAYLKLDGSSVMAQDALLRFQVGDGLYDWNARRGQGFGIIDYNTKAETPQYRFGFHIGGSHYRLDISHEWGANILAYRTYDQLATEVGSWISILDANNYESIVGNKFLKLTGGTITGLLTLKPQGYHAIDIVSPDTSLVQITMSSNDTLRGMFQYNVNFGFGFHHWGYGGLYVASDGVPKYVDSSNAKYPILHEGNFNSYAPTLTGTGATGTWNIHISGSATAVEGRGRLASANLTGNETQLKWFLASSSMTEGKPMSDSQVLHMPWDGDNYNAQLAIGHNGGEVFMQVRRQWQMVWSDWRTVAFTDSDITGYAAGLKHSNGTIGAVLSSFGNVTIGASDLAGDTCRLLVDGKFKVREKTSARLYTSIANAEVQIGRNSSLYTGGYNGGLSFGEDDTRLGYLAGIYNERNNGYTWFFYGGTNYSDAAIFIDGIGGNVGIGITGAAHKLDVNGTFRASGVATLSSRLLVNGATDNGSTGLQVIGGAHIQGDIANHLSNILTSGTGTWAKGYYAVNSSGTRLGGFGFLVGENSYLNYLFLGLYGNEWLTINAYESIFGVSTKFNAGALIPTGQTLKIGDATLSWDSTSNALKVDKDFYSDGQVSSGGVAEEGTGGAVGGSGLERVVFTIPANTTTFDCVHNLGTREISVAIYEEGNDYQQILTDVYLDSTNIARVVFGSATDVAHKVVIIG